MRNGSWSSFLERRNFPRSWFRDLRYRIWGLEFKHLKAHNFMWQGCFFFHYYLANLTTNWAKILTGLLFYAYVEIHKVVLSVICLNWIIICFVRHQISCRLELVYTSVYAPGIRWWEEYMDVKQNTNWNIDSGLQAL